jgi:hypothetical protein
VGDVICTLLGCSMSIVLRRGLSKKTFYIVGEAYLHPIKKYTPGYLAENLDFRGMVEIDIQ